MGGGGGKHPREKAETSTKSGGEWRSNGKKDYESCQEVGAGRGGGRKKKTETSERGEEIQRIRKKFFRASSRGKVEGPERQFLRRRGKRVCDGGKMRGIMNTIPHLIESFSLLSTTVAGNCARREEYRSKEKNANFILTKGWTRGWGGGGSV